MNLLIKAIAICFLLAGNAWAARTYELVEETKDYITYKDDYGTKYAYIKGLGVDLFQQFTIQESKGPKWQGHAEDYLEREHDFHEWSSYFGERMGDSCDDSFSDPERGYDAYNSWELRWNSVKPVRGSKKSAMYIVDFITLVHGDLGTCELHDAEYVFLNKKVGSKEEAETIYLGEFSASLPRGLR